MREALADLVRSCHEGGPAECQIIEALGEDA